jgi:class 3 adenylate cyclase/tetratricopeptide (TPR) repeat protein
MQCPRCQHANSATAKFCEECGQRLGDPSVSLPSYTPKHLAEKILTSRSAFEGERKQLTVLFADIKGSMELLADRDPEEARTILDPVLELMMEAVHRYEGTVNQVMGDGIMALFGAPVAHEDHAVRACYAALRMQDATRRYAEVQIRVGLNSGEVVVRSIGNDLHMDYTAVGQTTHLAARMEQMARPGSILMTLATFRLAEGFIQVSSLGSIPVRGLFHPVEVLELTSATGIRSRLQAVAARGLTTYVGRAAELDQLRQTMARARAGHGQIVAAVGEPGIGKSRLAWELTHSDATQDWLTIESSTVSFGRATPYLPIIELLHAYFQIEAHDTAERIVDKVTGKLLALDHALEPFQAPLLFLLDITPEDPRWEQLDPSQRRLCIHEAVRGLFSRESQAQPVLLIVENLHWIDGETQAFLDTLVDSLPTSSILLFVNYRLNYEHRWGGKSYYTQIFLDPLPPESIGTLIDALLGKDDDLAALKQLLIERTEGNPFFLEETVRTLVESGALAGQQGAYRLARAVRAVDIPASVQAVLAARIDRLPSAQKELLQTASVIGKDVPFTLLQTIAELPDQILYHGLHWLQAGEFLYETSLFPDPEYTFKHAMTHEVAYGSLLQNRRRALHGRILQAIETLYADRLSEYVDRLADHAFRGEVWEKAVTYLRQAGVKSVARSAYRQAITYLDQALTAWTHLPRNRDTLEQAVDLHLEIRTALVALGEIARTLGHLREAEALAESLGDRLRLARVLIYATSQLWLIGQHDQAVEAGRRAVTIASESDDLALRAGAWFSVALGYEAMGDYRQALESLQWSLRSLEGDWAYDRRAGIGVVAVLCHAWMVWCLAEIGQFAAAMEHSRQALRIAEAANHPASLVFAFRAVGLAHLRKGEVEQAIPTLERAFELCRSADVRTPFDVTAALLGHAYALGGRLAEAVPLMEQAVSDPASTGSANHPILLAYLGEGHLVSGHPDRAVAVAQRALDLARHQRERGNEAWVVRCLGEIAVQRDPPDSEAAGRYYREALALATDLGMRPLVAHCHLGLGKLYRRTGKRDQACNHLTTATTMYRAMDMRFWLEAADGELQELAEA